jgi:AcrR family transcriptional regulator
MMDPPSGSEGAPTIPGKNTDPPALLGRLWRLAGTSRLGRPAVLDVETVVRTAVDLADREGLAAATLPKVAKALGFTPMSLYRYVGSKDELLVLMHDSALGRPPRIGTPDWRDGLRQWAAAARAVNRRRPWLNRIPISGPPSGPNEVAWLESGLSILRDTDLDWSGKVGCLTLLNGYVRHATLLSQDLAQGRGAGNRADAERDYAHALVELIDPADYPETARLLRSGLFETAADDPALDEDFAYGLERVLDGIAAAVADPSH